MAGICRAEATIGEAFTLRTMDADPDVVPNHRRQIVLLARDQPADGLDPHVSEAEVLTWLPAGSLQATCVYPSPPGQASFALS